MKYSIILINKNDKRIAKTIEKIYFLINEFVEIIVVDASSGKLDWIRKKYPKLVWIDFKSEDRTTIPEQRNSGIESSKGDIILFLDSDCIPVDDWFEKLVEPIIKENENIVAGKVINSDKNSTHSIEFNKHEEHKYIHEAPTMNIAFRKKVFEDVGLFDPTFQIGEDVDLEWRASKYGYKIRFNKNAIIYHDLGSFRKELRRMYFYGKARIHLYKKHLQRIKYLPHELKVIFFPLFLFFLPLAVIYPIYLILIIPFFITNYKNEPLKLFSMRTVYGIGMLKEIIFPENYSG